MKKFPQADIPTHLSSRGTGFFVLAVAVALLVSCTPARPPRQSPVSLPAAFSATGSEPLSERWWQGFDDPALSPLIERALAGSLTLQSAWDRLDQAEALARRAGVELHPSLDGQGLAASTRTRTSGETRSGENFDLGLVTAYEIDLWGRIRSSREAARLDASASDADLQAAALSLSAQVASTWYQLVEQRGQLELLEAQMRTNEKVLVLISLQFRTGKTGIADVLQQRQLVETNRGELAQVTSRARVLEHQLAILLGEEPASAVLPPAGSLAELPPLPETGLPIELVQHRPDLRSAYADLLAADYRVAAAVADRFPRLSLGGRLETSGERSRELFDNWLGNLAGNLAAPLVDGGLRLAEVDRTRAAANERLHAYGQAILEALGEVEDALVREHLQREYIASLDRQLALAGQVIERIRDRYLKGAVDYQRVLDALLSHQRLQRTLLTARRELVENRIGLCRALGGGWTLERSGQKASTLSNSPRGGA